MNRIVKLGALITVLAVLSAMAIACGATEQTTTTVAPETTTTREAVVEETTTSEEAVEPDYSGTVWGVIKGDPEFSSFAAAIEAAGLVSRLTDTEGQITVFVPTNDAFASAVASMGIGLEDLLAYPDLTLILEYHLIPGYIDKAYINAQGVEQIEVDTVATYPLSISVGDAGDIMVGPDMVFVIDSDLTAPNGVAHVVDQVLIPTGLDF